MLYDPAWEIPRRPWRPLPQLKVSRFRLVATACTLAVVGSLWLIAVLAFLDHIRNEISVELHSNISLRSIR